MMVFLIRRAVTRMALLLATIVMVSAHAMTVPELQALLLSTARPLVPYQEVRESPWLGSPVTSRGVLRSTPQALEKEVVSPRRETWRILADRMEWVGATGTKEILFTQAPALGALANVLRHVIAGDLAPLGRDFRIEVQGSPQVWRAVLKPRSSELARQLDSVELQGTGDQLQVIIVTERQGERTTTRLQP